jgi:hypothetical protein
MELWLVAYGDYREDWSLFGPFSSRELAEAAIAERRSTNDFVVSPWGQDQYRQVYPEEHTLLRGTLDQVAEMEIAR